MTAGVQTSLILVFLYIWLSEVISLSWIAAVTPAIISTFHLVGRKKTGLEGQGIKGTILLLKSLLVDCMLHFSPSKN